MREKTPSPISNHSQIRKKSLILNSTLTKLEADPKPAPNIPTENGTGRFQSQNAATMKMGRTGNEAKNNRNKHSQNNSRPALNWVCVNMGYAMRMAIMRLVEFSASSVSTVGRRLFYEIVIYIMYYSICSMLFAHTSLLKPFRLFI